ncbi:Secondary metabolism regulator LAE1 [Lasiodiplodia hormozganensis]|uniref:Secondary metabolism regulator LAE1 n=1 Tax=Lasiodiplodia hormozganensis TaxID=869390 RepID=A0AA39YTL1_9PEZI|nr:Secondary metabolism regulator LAE1 [Lasiodiplodia hormozganensis]
MTSATIESSPAEHAAHQASTTIEVDSEVGSVAGYDSDTGSTSLSSSIRDHSFEFGRRYHRYQEGLYQFPNDEPEQERYAETVLEKVQKLTKVREDMKHYALVTAMGDRLHYAPIRDDPENILDLGTGTGIWCVEMGEQYPSALVQGVDLSPIQPTWLPPNVKFLVDDAEAPWVYPTDYFDLVHARHTVQAFRNYLGMLKQAHRHLRPGGWVELHEMNYTPSCDDGSMPDDYQLAKLLSLIGQGLAAMGINLDGVHNIKSQLRDAGFVNVRERTFKLPFGPWPKDRLLKKVGTYYQAIAMDGLQAIALRPLCKGLGWMPEEVEVFLTGVRKHLMDPSIHTYQVLHVIYAQKPQPS